MRVALGLIALMLLAACEGGGDPVEQAVRETATANQSAAVRETATVESAPVAAPSVDQSHVAALIAEHERALALAETVVRDGKDPEIRRMAEAMVASRTRELAELKAWTPAEGATPPA